MVKIATWNVNSIKARLPNVLEWLESAEPDVVLLQELKCVEENFPRLEIEALGYHVAAVGQKSYNGVAILSRQPIEDAVGRLPGEPEDEQARYLEATTFGLRVASLYLPNGNPSDSEKFPYKLRWMARLEAHARGLLESEQPVLLGGDYNVCPSDVDVYDPEAFKNDALCRPESRQAFRRIVNLGLTEAWRTLHGAPHVYSYWDYTGGAFENDNGLRIDHFLLSPQAADRLLSCDIDRAPRAKKKASDHTPVVCALAA
ncbi:MAG: exodeoxyribonuclease III [Rhodospirillales bacterium]|nr:exodeoxyribonuclease III [Rhodospirillales bacterium]